VFLPNYSSGNIKTNRIQSVSTCLAFFDAIWHFFTSGLAFFIHLDLATQLGNHDAVKRERSGMTGLE